MNDPYQMRQHFEYTQKEVIDIARKSFQEKLDSFVESMQFPEFKRVNYPSIFSILKGNSKP